MFLSEGETRAKARDYILAPKDGSEFGEKFGLTSQEPRAGFPLTLESKAAGLTKRSWIKISQIRTLSIGVILDWV